MIIVTPSLSSNIRHGFPSLTLPRCSNVVTARHCHLAKALEKHPNEPQLWLDDDISGLTDWHIAEMLGAASKSGAGVVVGWHFRRDGQLSACPKVRADSGAFTDIWMAAFGCALVMPWVWSVLDAETIYPIDTEPTISCPSAFDHVHTWDRRAWGEDHSFFIRCNRAGVRCVAANMVAVSHDGIACDAGMVQSLGEFAPSIAFVGSIAAASTSTAVLAVVGTVSDNRALTKEVETMSTDCGPHWTSPRFGAAVLSDGSILVKPEIAARLAARKCENIHDEINAIGLEFVNTLPPARRAVSSCGTAELGLFHQEGTICNN